MNSNSSLLSRLGLGAAILALIAFLIPVVAMLLGVIGVVQMNSDNDINNLLTGAVIVGIIALALAVLAVTPEPAGPLLRPAPGRRHADRLCAAAAALGGLPLRHGAAARRGGAEPQG